MPKKVALMAGLGKVQAVCETEGCERPAADGSRYCCDKCEGVAALNDPTMQADHLAECNHRAHKYFNRR
jgi:hypothetical protein